ncbi:MAG: hypothetical protein U0K83_05010 [Bacteroidales bacterium]|nr:hypothetical protein [Bacteroidales bacterium]
MKAVMLSIQPKWCEKIASGEKTVEVRKTRPKIETPFECFIYETNWSDNTYWKNRHKGKLGKVIGEFVCDRIIDIPYSQYFVDYYHTMPQAYLEATCLGMGHIDEYLLSKDGYGWHISDLVIYDKPKELGEFTGLRNTKFGYEPIKIKRPPQSWCYVEVQE